MESKRRKNRRHSKRATAEKPRQDHVGVECQKAKQSKKKAKAVEEAVQQSTEELRKKLAANTKEDGLNPLKREKLKIREKFYPHDLKEDGPKQDAERLAEPKHGSREEARDGLKNTK